MSRRRLLKLGALLFVIAVVVPTVPSIAGPISHPVVVSADPADWTPDVLDGRVNAIIQMGTKVIVGGTFTQVRRRGTSAILTRNYLFAFDMQTGIIDPTFVPVLDRSVEALAPGADGTSVIVGGDFSTVNGVSYRKLARLNLSNGQAMPAFKANTNSLVQDVVLNNGWLYVSGKFTSIKNTPRSGVARINPTTGAVDPNFNLPFTDPLRGSLGVPRIEVSPDGTKLVAIGSFSKVAGLDRVQIAVLDVGVTPATVSTWQTDLTPIYIPGTTTTWCASAFSTWMRDVDIAPDGSYFALVTTGAFRANRLCDTVTRWELTASGPGQTPTWVDSTGGDTFWAVTATGTAIYVGGHHRWLNNPYRGDAAGPGAVTRDGIGALDPINGLPFSWDPTHERGVGIFTMPATADGLWAGSDTDHAGGEFHQKIVLFPTQGGMAPPPTVTYGLPNDLYNMSSSTGVLSRRAYDLSMFGPVSPVVTGVDWRSARGAFVVSDKLYTGWSDATFTVRDFAGAVVGPPTTIPLNGLEVQPPTGFNIPGTTTRVPAFTTDLASMTGMFFDNGRIYYTVNRPGGGATNAANNNRLYYRYFTPESGIVGANLFVASSFPADTGVPWGVVRGMTLASGKLIYATTDGNLWSVNWGGTAPTGSPTLIAGPGVDGTNWASTGMFAFDQTDDSFPPTQPGKPSGTSSSFDSIDLTWQASSDNLSTSIVYRVYRDGLEVDQVTSSSTTTVGYQDTGLDPGSVHTYTVDALDEESNVSLMSDVSDPIMVLAPDTTPPSDPGVPTGVSNSTSSIDLSFDASIDNESTTLTYRVYRDDPSNEVGQVVSSSTGTITFTDTGLAQGSTHTYWVDAVDEATNASNKIQSAPIQTLSAFFADDFSSGTFANWTSVTRLTIDAGLGSPNPPSARAAVTAQSAFAYRDLPSTYAAACLSVRVNVQSSGGTSVDLFRLRSAGNGALAKVYVDTAGTLFIRADFSGAQVSSGDQLGSGWHTIELCGTVGSATTWELYRDGSRIVDPWTANTGTNPIARVQIGDNAAKTFTMNLDDVILDATPN